MELTRVNGHSNMSEDALFRFLDLEEVLGVRTDLGPVEKLCPAVDREGRKILRDQIDAKVSEGVKRRERKGEKRETTNLFAVDRVDLDARREVPLEVKSIDVDFVDGSRSSTARTKAGQLPALVRTRERKTRLSNSQLDDHEIEMVGSPAPLGLPSITHILPSSGKKQVGSSSVVLVALVHKSSSVERVGEVDLPFVGSIPGLSGSPGGSDDSVGPESSDSSIGEHVETEMRERGRGGRNGEKVTGGGTERDLREKRGPGRVLGGDRIRRVDSVY